MKNSLVVPKKLKIELPYDPIPGHTSGRKHDLKDTCTPMFIAALFIIANTWKQMSIDRKMDNENVVHIYNRINSQPLKK